MTFDLIAQAEVFPSFWEYMQEPVVSGFVFHFLWSLLYYPLHMKSEVKSMH